MIKTLICVLAFLVAGSATAGTDWTAVWLEDAPTTMRTGEMYSYRIMGLTGADTRADLTFSPHLVIVSSHPSVIEIDRKKAVLLAKAPGRVRLCFRFGSTAGHAEITVEESRPNRSAD